MDTLHLLVLVLFEIARIDREQQVFLSAILPILFMLQGEWQQLLNPSCIDRVHIHMPMIQKMDQALMLHLLLPGLTQPFTIDLPFQIDHPMNQHVRVQVARLMKGPSK
jgi:hypothetical protein